MVEDGSPDEVAPADRPIHVLHVIDSLGALGGAERGFVQELVRFRRVRSTVVVLADHVPLLGQLEAAGIEVIQLGLPMGGSAARVLPKAAWRVSAIARRLRPDVIHTSLFNADVAGQIAGLVAHRPVVSSLVSSGDRYRSGDAPGPPPARRAMLGLRTGLARVGRARYRALTEYTARSNGEVLGIDLENVTVIPRGVDLARFAEGGADAPPLIAGTPTFVNVGRHEANKAQWDLVEAFARTRPELPEARLRILGLEGAYTPLLHELCTRFGVTDRVDFLDTLDNPSGVLRASDVFAFSSHEEGLGTAVVEALAVGLPIVAYDIGPVREVTDQGRLADLVTCGDVAALARAMVAAGSSPTSPALAEERRQWVESRFEADLIAGQVEDLLVASART